VPPLSTGNAVPEYDIANVPLLVIGLPVTDKNAGTVAATDVTVPEPLPLNVDQSVLVRYPSADALAAAMLIAGVAPPEDTTGAVPVTEVTVPEPFPLKVVQSVEVRYPLTEVVAAGMLITGVAPPVDATGEVALTLVTVPEPLLLNVDQSALVNTPRLVADASGTFSVMMGVVVLFWTVEVRSEPVDPNVSAATDVTVPDPEPLLLNVFQSVLVR
jgi:hypothetical protein